MANRSLGESSESIPTPALVIDAATARRNIRRLADYAKSVDLDVRPHTKTHKLRHVARLQLQSGAIGLTAAKVTEAEIISDPDQDLLLAYPPVGGHRAQRLAMLAKDRCVRAAVDSTTAIEIVSQAAAKHGTTIGLLIELDVGMGRTGVLSPGATIPLAEAIDRAANVRLDGIMIYPGHIWDPVEDQVAGLKAVDNLLTETMDLWTARGWAAEIVSGGSTPTAYQSHRVERLTEIRPGTYVFNDMNTVRGGYCSISDCAARIHATVISTAVADQVVIDAGSKTLSNDRCIPAPESGFGCVLEYEGARITRLSEEHGQVDISMCESRPTVGERVTVVPNHVCPCVNLQESIWWQEPGEAPQRMKVDARGRIQ